VNKSTYELCINDIYVIFTYYNNIAYRLHTLIHYIIIPFVWLGKIVKYSSDKWYWCIMHFDYLETLHQIALVYKSNYCSGYGYTMAVVWIPAGYDKLTAHYLYYYHYLSVIGFECFTAFLCFCYVILLTRPDVHI